MREPIMRDGRYTGIADQNLINAAGGGVTLVRGLDIAFKQATDMRQPLGKCLVMAKACSRSGCSYVFKAGNEAQFAAHLHQEFPECGVQRVSDIIVHAFIGEFR